MNLDAFNEFVQKFCHRDDKDFLETPSELGRLIYSLLVVERPEIVVEVGSHVGATSAWIMRALDELGAGHLEAWESDAGAVRQWNDNMRRIWPEAIPGYSRQGDFHTLKGVKCDVAFIDHSPKRDYVAAFERFDFKVGDIVLAHDLTYTGRERNKHNEGVWRLHDRLLAEGWAVFPVYGCRGLTMARKVS